MGGLVVHEWIEQRGGAELVVDSFVRALDVDRVHCLWDDAPGRFGDVAVSESWLSRTPLRGRKALALPFMSREWRTLDIGSADWVLASSHSFAHHVASVGGRRRLPTYVYAYTPARYLWAPELDERARSTAALPLVAHLKRQDRRYAGTGARYAVLSRFVQQRAQRAWGIETELIYPPVRVAELQAVPRWAETLSDPDAEVLRSLPGDFVLGASRFVPYKRLEDVIRVAEGSDVPAVIVGTGPHEPVLRERARAATVPVHFVINPSDSLLRAVMQAALVFVFPPVEDFGIVPLEAIALGTPVLVNQVGGAHETLERVGGGVAVDFQGPLADAVTDAAGADTAAAESAVRLFDTARFEREIADWVGASAST